MADGVAVAVVVEAVVEAAVEGVVGGMDQGRRTVSASRGETLGRVSLVATAGLVTLALREARSRSLLSARQLKFLDSSSSSLQAPSNL